METTGNVSVKSEVKIEVKTEETDTDNLAQADITEIYDEFSEEEDVPGDFFDDFLKEDFMAGLDIVDEDGEDTEEPSPEREKKRLVLRRNVSDRQFSKRMSQKIDHVKKFREDEIRRLNAELDEIRQVKVRKPAKEKAGIDADDFDIRRDPEKTRRDIQMDKIRCAKDKEKKLITDIVETGLVPPGMELEVDLDEVRRQERIEKNKPPVDLRARLKPRRSKSTEKKKGSPSVEEKKPEENKPEPKKKSTSPVHRHKKRSSPLKKSNSPKRKRSRSPGKAARREYHDKTIRRERENARRSPLYRRVSRSPIFRRSPGYHRSRSPYGRDRSPYNRKRRDRSFSPRERPYRSRSKNKVLRKKEERRSFLEELVEKLNEPRPVMPQPIPYNIPSSQTIIPIPAPVPAPQNSFRPLVLTPQPQHIPTPTAFDPYDQNFFIGSHPNSQGANFSNQPLQSPLGVPTTESGNNQLNTARNRDTPVRDEATKLLTDQKMKLSEFLAISAKPQVSSSSPASLQEKIKVIQRCQEAIKILSSNRKFIGPFVVSQKKNIQESLNAKNISPMLRKPIIQLPFTTPGLKRNIEEDFTRFCQSLVFRVGMEKKITSDVKEAETPVQLPVAEQIEYLQSPPAIVEPRNLRRGQHKVIFTTVSVQTDRELIECRECYVRKNTDYLHCGVQCGEPMLTFSVSTQVHESDFYSTIPKNQSLASLTPAQLLGKQMRNYDASASVPKEVDLQSKIFDMVSWRGGNPPDFPPRRFDSGPPKVDFQQPRDFGVSQQRDFELPLRNNFEPKPSLYNFQSKNFGSSGNLSDVPHSLPPMNSNMSLSATLRASMGQGVRESMPNPKFPPYRNV